jgi:hypothetical protein
VVVVVVVVVSSDWWRRSREEEVARGSSRDSRINFIANEEDYSSFLTCESDQRANAIPRTHFELTWPRFPKLKHSINLEYITEIASTTNFV